MSKKELTNLLYLYDTQAIIKAFDILGVESLTGMDYVYDYEVEDVLDMLEEYELFEIYTTVKSL